MTLDRSTVHGVMPTPDPFEARLQHQVVGMKRQLAILTDGVRSAFTREMEPAFITAQGRAPQSRREVAALMQGHPTYRAWSDLQMLAQQAMWHAVGHTIMRERDRITAEAARLRAERPAGGILTLDPGISRPDDVFVTDIHGQPGGYMRDEGPDDILAGAFYELGGNLYTFGAGTGRTDSKAAVVIAHYERIALDQRPRRILDVGCSVGGSTLPYKHAFPEAEVCGIDVAPALLRYAHARAESLGYAVHFSQVNAVQAGFENESFDLIVAHNLMHEVSTPSLRRILAETHRMLAPGGITLLQDVPVAYARMSPIEQFISGWQTEHNHEPHWDAYATCDVPALLREAGFAKERINEARLARFAGPGVWYVVSAAKGHAN